MKNFLISFLATLTGIIVSFFVILIITIGIIGALISKEDKLVQVKPNSILYMKLDKPITDREPASPLEFSRFSRKKNLGLNEILRKIEKAKTDENIKGIYIETAFVAAGLATVEEIREALLDFRKSGKFVIAYSEIYTQKAYYLATAAEKILYNPSGYFNMTGLRVQTTHLKKALDKLNIEPVIVRVGEYKGAVEVYELDKMSKENKEQLQRLVTVFWDNICTNISNKRRISKDSLNYLIDNLKLSDPTEVLKYGLVDSLVQKGDVISYLKELTDIPEKKELRSIKLTKYAKLVKNLVQKGISAKKLAVIYASGEIIRGEGENYNIGGERFAREIRKARSDSSIKAIVLRVNSPGGSALASEVIYDEIQKTKGVKPIVVSMGDVAASGGYYISCAADSILANPNTVTGSIGIFSIFFNGKGFFDKLGITFDVAKSHEYSDFLSGTRKLEREEIDYLQHMLEYSYDIFISHVSEGRGMDYKEVNNIARGRVWGGNDALDVKLIDKFGGLQDAIETATKMAGIEDDYRIVELPEPVDPLEQLINELTGEAKVYEILEKLHIEKQVFTSLKDILQNQGTMARLPYIYNIQ